MNVVDVLSLSKICDTRRMLHVHQYTQYKHSTAHYTHLILFCRAPWATDIHTQWQ